MYNPAEERQEAIQQMQISIEKATELVDMADAITRLRALPDFQTVIMKGYLEQECINLVHRKSAENHQSDEDQRSLDFDIRAIGSFSSFLQRILQHGEMSRSAILNDREELARAQEETDEDLH